MAAPANLIDKGTHMEDAEGNRYARDTPKNPKKPKKRRNLIKPADSDILFGLYIEKAQGRITLAQIADATGFTSSAISTHAKKKGFDEKIERILKTTKSSASLTAEKVQSNLAGILLYGAEEHQQSINYLLAKTRGHFKKMKGPTILKSAKDIDTLDKMGRRLYGLDKEEQRAASAPVLNMQFLMGVGMTPVTVSTAIGAAAPLPQPDSSES